MLKEGRRVDRADGTTLNSVQFPLADIQLDLLLVDFALTFALAALGGEDAGLAARLEPEHQGVA